MPDDSELYGTGMAMKGGKAKALELVTDVMDDEMYDATWVRSVARKGRSDAQMRALHPDLDAYMLGKDSDLISYHKRVAPKAQDAVS